MNPDELLNADPASVVYSPPVPDGYAVENPSQCLDEMTTRAWSESIRAEAAESARDRFASLLARSRPFMRHSPICSTQLFPGTFCSCGLDDLLAETPREEA